MTAALDRVERRVLVGRRAFPSARRARVVFLTPAGRALIGKAFERHAADMEQAASVLSRSERSALVGLLKKLGKGEL
jgi:DNA-binding MarR family transcriptional regulator